MENKKLGTVEIANDAIARIAGLAATDVKGVACLAGGISHEKMQNSPDAKIRKAIRVENVEGSFSLTLFVVLNGTVPVPVVSRELEEKVHSMIETMTGMPCDSVSVVISGVAL